MLKEKGSQPDRNTVGVINGRFQVHELHSAHIELIETVLVRHKTVIIVLGVPTIIGSKRNALDFIARKQMFEQTFTTEHLAKTNNTLVVIPNPDNRYDDVWSKQIDKRIREIVPTGEIIMYGSRDSFIKQYNGQFKTIELETNVFISGTDVRRDVCNEVKADSAFRRGVIYGASRRYDSGLPTVDIALFKEQDDKHFLLLARKPREREFRLPGGFFDPHKDKSYLDTARRELREETQIEAGDFEYITSTVIDDWRFRNEGDKIITTLFAATYVYGSIKPDDDIEELRWVDTWFLIGNKNKDEMVIVPEHQPLITALYQKYSLWFV